MVSEPQDGGPCVNTDRHLWPDVSEPGAVHESIHVTAQGGIGINVGGFVYVKTLREWHKLAGGPWSVRDEKALTSKQQLHRLVHAGELRPTRCIHNVELWQGCFCPTCPIEDAPIQSNAQVAKTELQRVYKLVDHWYGEAMRLEAELTRRATETTCKHGRAERWAKFCPDCGSPLKTGAEP